MSKKIIPHRLFVQIDGIDVPWTSLTEEEQKKISIELNDRAILSLGYRHKDETA